MSSIIYSIKFISYRSYTLSADFLALTNGICKGPLHITGNETYHTAKILLCSLSLSFLIPNLLNTRPDSVHTALTIIMKIPHLGQRSGRSNSEGT